MPPASAKPPARKRQRKRKRRAASSSSSSSSSDSDISSGSDRPAVRKVKVVRVAPKPEPAEDETSSSSSTSSNESSDSDLRHKQARKDVFISAAVEREQDEVGLDGIQAIHEAGPAGRRRRSPSPDVPIRPMPPPSFFPDTGNPEEDQRKEQELKAKFRKLWMSSIADAFKDDLEVIQKEPNMNQSRLAVLIESLASGADVFSSSAKPGTNEVNEIQLVLDTAEKRENSQALSRNTHADEDVDMADESE